MIFAWHGVILRTMKIELYTDGSCLGNPGPGGWAYLLRVDGKEQRQQGGAPHTTNNRMELLAVIEGFEAIHEAYPSAQDITVFSDSSWVVKTMTDNWKRKKNLDLWERLLPLLLEKDVNWQWVKGHAGHAENEDCDLRAFAEAQKQQLLARSMDPKELRLPDDPQALF